MVSQASLISEAEQQERSGEEEMSTVEQKIRQRFVNITEYKLPSREDFEAFREICQSSEGWVELSRTKEYTLYRLTIKLDSGKEITVFKIEASRTDIDATTMYNMLHDPDYRRVWDDNMEYGFNICRPSKYADIGFYSFKFPRLTMLGKRMSIAQRNWYKYGEGEYTIYNHSVRKPHQFEEACKVNNAPVDPEKYVELDSYCSGYYMKDDGPKLNFTYIACSDIKTVISDKIINLACQWNLPKIIANLFNQGAKYNKWSGRDESKWIWVTDNWAKDEESEEYKKESEDALQLLQG